MTEYIPQRIGFYTLRKLAYGLCKALPQFSPIIRATFPNNAALLAALAAAEASCGVLVMEIDKAKADIFPP